ncbi:hypothetical protein DPV78_006881 [Talaromyces pinophilus]|nr:hypothetical protein DPV78_006881 [Talaromyces pinophilus]
MLWMKNNLVPSTLSKGPLGYTSLASAKKQGSRYEENAERLKKIKPSVKEYAQGIRDWNLMVEHDAKTKKATRRIPFFSIAIMHLSVHQWKTLGYISICRTRSWNLTDSAAASRMPKVIWVNSKIQYHDYDRRSLWLLLVRNRWRSIRDQKLPFDQRTRINNDRSVKAFLQRLVLALFGGVVLVGPMLLMVLFNNQTVSLATTSVAVFEFASVVSAYSNGPAEGLVGVVAAYAAVMVVFVGASK